MTINPPPATEFLLFEGQEIRMTFHDKQWWYVVRDVIQVITESADVKDYIKKLRKRDPELQKIWQNLVTPLLIETTGGRQKLNCATINNLSRIMLAIPAAKSETFKRWISTPVKD